MIKVKTLATRILSLSYPDYYELGMTFIRMQEFYESDNEKIRRSYFTLEEILDYNYKKHGTFNYFETWGAYNLSNEGIEGFRREFAHRGLSQREMKFFNLLDKWRKHQRVETYSVIGTYQDRGEKDYIAHELAHSMYYLDKDYKIEMDQQLKETPKPRINKALRKIGYHRDVLDDEIQAYLSTSDNKELKEMFKVKGTNKYVKKFRKIFRKYYRKIAELKN